MRTFVVTVQQVITTKIEVEAADAKAARQIVEAYGPDIAAKDMAVQDFSSETKIKSVKLQ